MRIVRNCPICGNSEKIIIFKQHLPANEVFYASYDVVICTKCDFAYSDNTEEQSDVERYYKSDSRADYDLLRKNRTIGQLENKDIVENEWDIRRHENTLKNILSFVSKSDKILEIGCGTGHILYCLKESGYSNCEGIEPSFSASMVGSQKYGLKIHNCNLPDFVSNRKSTNYDFIILSHILEHVVDLRSFILDIQELLAFQRGLVYIEVPDVHKFSLSADPAKVLCEPHANDLFVQFTPEHVNFFSENSLINLMRRFGFNKVFLETQVSTMGIISSVWQTYQPIKDDLIVEDLNYYIERSKEMLFNPISVINSLVESRKPIIIWGAGLHTRRLISTCNLGKVNIIAFIDSDPRYVNTTLIGIPIYNPSQIPTLPKNPILISSKRHQTNIATQIEKEGWGNEIILLYPSDITKY